MSRIGKQPIEIPSGVDIDVAEGNLVTVKGPRGTLTQGMHPDMRIVVDAGVVTVERPDDEGCARIQREGSRCRWQREHSVQHGERDRPIARAPSTPEAST